MLTEKLPNKIYLMRHLLSQGNVDRNIYNQIPDHKISIYDEHNYEKHRLTLASSGFPAIVKDRYSSENPLLVKTSRYLRVTQTLKVLEGLVCSNNTFLINKTFRTDSLLHEIKCKENLTQTSEEYLESLSKERQEYGQFYHTWPGGESPLQVHQRCLTWWNNYRLNSFSSFAKQEDLLIISHNQTLQELLIILTSRTDYSELNFENGEVVELTLNIQKNCYDYTKSYKPLYQIIETK